MQCHSCISAQNYYSPYVYSWIPSIFKKVQFCLHNELFTSKSGKTGHIIQSEYKEVNDMRPQKNMVQGMCALLKQKAICMIRLFDAI